MELKAHFYKDLSIKKMGLFGIINGKDMFLFGNCQITFDPSQLSYRRFGALLYH